jgi:predicted deacylase
MTIETLVFHGDGTGPHLLITARIHGNEPCGEIALRRIATEIQNKTILLKSGTLTLLPVCNSDASIANKRFIDINLNRIMAPDLAATHSHSAEGKIAPIIMRHIDQCDYFVDLHSFTENMPPVTICLDDKNPASQKLAQAALNKRIELNSTMISGAGTAMTVHYAKQAKKPSILIECGQHNDEKAIEVAYQAIINILKHLKMINGHAQTLQNHQFTRISSAIYNEPGMELIFPIMDHTNITVGTPLFKNHLEQIIYARHDGLLFMRNINTPGGEEYCYICDIKSDWPKG